MCNTKVFWKAQGSGMTLYDSTSWHTPFLPSSENHLSEITSKEDLGNALLFPSFLPAENCNLLFDFLYKTGLQRNSKEKKACLKTSQPDIQQELLIQAWGNLTAGCCHISLRIAMASVCFCHHLHLLAWTIATGATTPTHEQDSPWNVHGFCCKDLSDITEVSAWWISQPRASGWHAASPYNNPTFWPWYLVNADKISHLGLISEYRKNSWGVGPGYSWVPNTNTVFSCSAVSHFGVTTHPWVKCHLLSPLFPTEASLTESSWGGAHSLSPLGYHLETPTRYQITGNQPP